MEAGRIGQSGQTVIRRVETERELEHEVVTIRLRLMVVLSVLD